MNRNVADKIVREIRGKIEKAIPEIVNRSVDVIKKDITDGIVRGQDIHGKPFRPLKPSTIYSKNYRDSPYPDRVLWDKGIMQNCYVIQRASISKPMAILIVPKSRKNIGKYHNEGTSPYIIRAKYTKYLRFIGSDGKWKQKKQVKHPGHLTREWFGVSVRAEKVLAKIQRQIMDKYFKG